MPLRNNALRHSILKAILLDKDLLDTQSARSSAKVILHLVAYLEFPS